MNQNNITLFVLLNDKVFGLVMQNKVSEKETKQNEKKTTWQKKTTDQSKTFQVQGEGYGIIQFISILYWFVRLVQTFDDTNT